MKTTNVLKKAEVIVNGVVVEEAEVKNPCQMWKQLNGWFEKHGDAAEVKVYRENDTLYKDFTIKTLKNGKKTKVNAIKETNRKSVKKPQIVAAVAEKPADAAEAPAEAPAEA